MGSSSTGKSQSSSALPLGPYGVLEQFERPDSAQSCRRDAPPRMWVNSSPPKISSTITTMPMRAARRVAGSGSRSGGCQWSGFLMMYLFGNWCHRVFQADKSSMWRRLSIKCRTKRGACATVSISSRYANGGSASTGLDANRPRIAPGFRLVASMKRLTVSDPGRSRRERGSAVEPKFYRSN